MQVSRVAKAMITQLGFSTKLGQVAWSGGSGPTNLGQSMGQGPDCSAQTTNEIDQEVKALVERAYRCFTPLSGTWDESVHQSCCDAVAPPTWGSPWARAPTAAYRPPTRSTRRSRPWWSVPTGASLPLEVH